MNSQKLEVVHIVLDGEMTIDAPTKEVWPHVINYTSWQKFSLVQHVSGTPGQEGEIYLLRKAEQNSSPEPYLARTIRIEPGRKIVWKTYRENVPGFGIVEFLIDDVQGKTRFSYRCYYEDFPAEKEAFRQQRSEYLAALTATVFGRLKTLVEKRG